MANVPITDVAQNIIKPYINTQDKAYAANIAPVETSPATSAHTAGTQIIYNGVLYNVTANIAADDPLATTGAGANIAVADKVTEQISSQKQALSDEINNNANNGVKNQLIPNQNLVVTNNASGTISVPVGTLVLDKIQSLVLSFEQANAVSSIARNTLLLHPASGSELYPTNVVSPTINAGYHEGVINNVPAGTYEVRIWSQNPNVYVEYTNFMIRDISITDNTYQEPTKTNTELTKDDSGLTANAFANGAVNELENKATSQVVYGVTFTVNSDKSVTISTGSEGATNIATLTINNQIPSSLKNKPIKISGCPSGGASNKYELQVYDDANNIIRDYGDGNTGRISAANPYVAIVIRTGTVLTTPVTFKPMITDADMPNSDYNHYVPYALSNKKLTDDVLSLAMAKMISFGNQLETTADANDCMVSGGNGLKLFYGLYSSQYEHFPSSFTGGVLVVLAAGGFHWQFCSDYNPLAYSLYFRKKYQDNWGEWKALTLS